MPSTITASPSELDSLRQCLFKHEHGYKQRWQAPTIGPALSRGIAWHTVMETHYRTIKTLQEARAAARKEGKAALKRYDLEHNETVWAKTIFDAVKPLLWSPITAQQTEQQELIEWMYQGYVEQYGLDPDWEILAVEHAPEVWLVNERGNRSRFRLKMKIDLIIRERSSGNVYLVDHKSGKDLPSDKMLEINDQFGLYTWGMRQIGRTVFGSIHNACRTQRNKDQARHPQTLESRHARKRLYRTDVELDAIALDAYRALRHAYSIPVGEAPRSPNEDTCRWRCDYTEPCLMARKGIGTMQENLRQLGFVQDFTRH
jgi:hypothetical protein